MTLRNDRLLRALRRQAVDCTPVWFMRQAGRYLPEYRQLREKYDFLTLSQNPELAAQITLMPLQRFELDAVILFADILLPLVGVGVDLEYTASGDGPLIRNTLRNAADVERLRVPSPEEGVPFVLEAIRLARHLLDGRVPLIGFAGAPFTLASYLIEGGASRNYQRTKAFMFQERVAWRELLEKLTHLTSDYLRAQVRAGAQALQLFDSWVGCLAPSDYQDYVLPYSRQVILAARSEGVPVIHFGTGTAGLLEAMREAGGDVIGIDWRIDLDAAWQRVGPEVGIQGNLDPTALLGPWPEVQSRVQDILDRAAGRPGHIFNLGHGLLPETPPENVAALVDYVHEHTQR